ncbi:MAG: hypothetical protein JSV16_14680 [Candidatus Hydrogenedentota bacterium]|nr:MAG: hypothetical protein JSV16_14680 [Candidatus Hydrogenedentota bacterium]
MSSMERTRSPHVKLQEFIDCFLESDYKKELEEFSSPHLMRPTRENVPDEALRYLAVVLLYAIAESAKDISIVRKKPGEAVCRMTGKKFYDIPTPKEEVMVALFEEIEEMASMDRTKRSGKLIIGLKSDEIDLNISSMVTDLGEDKILIQLPPSA